MFPASIAYNKHQFKCRKKYEAKQLLDTQIYNF